MAFYYKWDVKNDFPYVLQFFSLISDGLGSVNFFISFIQHLLKLAESTEYKKGHVLTNVE
jgi:hypothetical protein